MNLESVTQTVTQSVKSAINPDVKADPLGRGLGFFSIALGLTEVIAPTLLASAIGVDPKGSGPMIMRAFGAREIGAGISVLLRPNRPIPLWARVVGDAMDLAALGLAARSKRSSPGKLAFAAVAVAGVTALDVLASLRAQKLSADADQLVDSKDPAVVEAKPVVQAPVTRKSDKLAPVEGMANVAAEKMTH